MRALVALAVLVAAPALAHPSIGIARGAGGEIFYSDLEQVWRIDPDGRKTVAVPRVHSHELYLDHEGNLFGEHVWYEGEATDRWGHRVWRRAPDGTVVDAIPARAGFRTDYSFARDDAGNMYWVEAGRPTLLRRKAPDGAVSTIASGPFGNPNWLAAAGDGTLFFTTDGDLWRVGPAGRSRVLARGLAERRLTQPQAGDRHALFGVWPDRAGGAYVAVYGARVVKHVSAQGAVTEAARSSWPWSPTGGLLAPDGALWLLETSLTNAARVRRIGADGKERIY